MVNMSGQLGILKSQPYNISDFGQIKLIVIVENTLMLCLHFSEPRDDTILGENPQKTSKILYCCASQIDNNLKSQRY